MQRFDDAPRAERRGGGGLQHHGVAANQRGRELPGGNGAREIPRRDQAHDADRLADGEHVDAVALGGREQAGQPRALAGKVAEDVDRAAHLALRFGQRLAFLARHFGGDLLEAAVEDGGGFEEDLAAPRRAHRAPGRQSRGGRSGGIFHVARRPAHKAADHLIGVRGVAIFECLGAFDPFAPDVVGKDRCHSHCPVAVGR